MNKEDITLCIIAKNESKGLRRAVDSARPMCDKVVIGIDIESDDATVKLAQELADEHFLFAFKDNFSDFRNACAQYVKTDWIFWLDGHEYVKNPIDFNETIDNQPDAYVIRHEIETGMTHLRPHLIRRGIQWVGAIHEQPLVKKPKAIKSGLVIHDRIGGQDRADSVARGIQRDYQMVQIMEKELKKNKKDIRALFHLALYYQSKEESKEAIKFYRQYLKYSIDKTERFLAYIYMADCFISFAKYKEALNILKEGVVDCGEMWEFNLGIGKLYAAHSDHKIAIDYFNTSLKMNTQLQRYFPFKHNFSEIYNLIANEYYMLHDFVNAALFWQSAIDACTVKEMRDLFQTRYKIMIDIEASKKMTMA